MSTYATIAESEDLNSDGAWLVSVDTINSGSPIRIDHGDECWYLPEDVVDKILAALRVEKRSRPRPPCPIVATFVRYGSKGTERYETFKDAAIAAAVNCDANTAAYSEAENVETGEKWTRGELLDAGFALIEGTRE